jgi:hypothetical protein
LTRVDTVSVSARSVRPPIKHKENLTNKQALNNLGQFTGTDQYHRHLNLLCTDGVMFLAQNADCFWLLDAIASYQTKLTANPRLRDFQLWKLIVHRDRTFNPAVLTCTDGDTADSIVTQTIEATDFPLPSIRLYVESGVLLLPSEH